MTPIRSASSRPADRLVAASPAALTTLRRLRAAHGPLVLHQSAGCCDGTTPICVRADELPPGPADVLLGELAGVPFYIDRDLDRRWRHPQFFIDVAPGETGGFSLEEADGHHFVTYTALHKASDELP